MFYCPGLIQLFEDLSGMENTFVTTDSAEIQYWFFLNVLFCFDDTLM